MVWGGTLTQEQAGALRSAGATAYVSALARPGELVEVVRRARGVGDGWPPMAPPAPRLTRRELEVARAYLVTGAERTRRQVADDLAVSERTVKSHLANIRAKTGHEGTGTREGLRHVLTGRGILPGPFGGSRPVDVQRTIR